MPRWTRSCRCETDTDELDAFYEQLEEHGIDATTRAPLHEFADLSHHTTDALSLFLNEAGRYPLLTPARRSSWPSGSRRATSHAKDRMINSNLRLVVSNARRYQGQGLPSAT